LEVLKAVSSGGKQGDSVNELGIGSKAASEN
jgi:sugar phosphate permease